MAVKIKKFPVRGFKELQRALNGLTEPKFRKAALRRAGKFAMKPVQMDAMRNAPFLKDKLRNPDVPIGLLKTDIKMSTRVNINPSIHKNGKVRKTSKHELSVMVKTTKKTEAFALTVEFGKREFMITRTVAFGKETKEYITISPETKPQKFMAPALDDNYRSVFFNFRDELTKEVAKQARAMAKYIAKRGSK